MSLKSFADFLKLDSSIDDLKLAEAFDRKQAKLKATWLLNSVVKLHRQNLADKSANAAQIRVSYQNVLLASLVMALIETLTVENSSP